MRLPVLSVLLALVIAGCGSDDLAAKRRDVKKAVAVCKGKGGFESAKRHDATLVVVCGNGMKRVISVGG